MIRKSFAFALQKQTKSDFGIDLKRSHAYEFIAAYLGFSSQAAMDTQGVLFKSIDRWLGDDSSTGEDQKKSILLCQNRALNLDYIAEQAQLVAEVLSRMYLELDLSFIEYSEIVESFWDLEEVSDDNLKSLKTLASNGNSDAIFCLACIYKTETPPAERDGHWYRERQKGTVLSVVQAEFADEYKQSVDNFKLRHSLLIEAADKGHAVAAFELAELDDGDSETWYRRSADLGCVEAQSVLALTYNENDWLVKAAEGGDRGCLYELAQAASNRTDEQSVVDAHKWIILADLYGYNLTQSLADNDEDYGPAFVIFEGVNLPKISGPLRAQAAREASDIYQGSSN
tara:strand:- start:2241 stop:3266 length:1026 start_codon:yes stop_codon:yes gene_type:complete